MVGKGGVWRGYILALILGLIVISLSLWFLFFEYFTSEELDWQGCRQSIVLRANAPNLEELATDMKGAFPLKCRTEVVTIDSGNAEEAYRKIADAVARGWYMFGEGEFDFVHKEVYNSKSYCMAFARLHYTGEASDEFYENAGISRADAEDIVEKVRREEKDARVVSGANINSGATGIISLVARSDAKDFEVEDRADYLVGWVLKMDGGKLKFSKEGFLSRMNGEYEVGFVLHGDDIYLHGEDSGMSIVEKDGGLKYDIIETKSGVKLGEIVGSMSIPRMLIDFDINFTKFYRTKKVPGSKGTYNDYLPLFSKSSANISHFFIMDSLAPINDDTILVYKIGTTAGAAGSLVGKLSSGGMTAIAIAGGMILAPFTFGASLTVVAAAAGGAWVVASDMNFWGGESEAKRLGALAKMQRKIIAVSPENLDKIECQEYLAIPA